MGKTLVIKGADFSENGILIHYPLDHYMECVVGQGWTTSNGFTKTSNSARVSSNVVQTNVFTGITGIRLTPKSGYKLASVIHDNIVEGQMGTALNTDWTGSYNTDARILSFADGNSFVIMVAPTGSGATTSNSWDTYIDFEYIYE